MTTAPLVLVIAILVMMRADFRLRQGDLPPPLVSAYRFCGWVAVLVAGLALAVLTTPARAQHDHALGHPDYREWENKKGKGCCNNDDCGFLADDEERRTTTGIEVKIEGQWCAVQPWMYLQKGNAPDWSHAHACVLPKKTYTEMGPCERLQCYQGKPEF